MSGIFKAEIKRSFFERKFIVLLIISIAITLVLVLYRISTFSYIHINANEDIEKYHGKEGIEKYIEYGKQGDEYLTEEGLISDVRLYKEIYEKYNGDKTTEFEIELSKMRYRFFLPYAFEPKEGSPRYRVDYENLTLEEIHSFYENRSKQQMNLFIEKTDDDSTLVNRLLEMEKSVEKPFKLNFIKSISFDEEIDGIFLIFMYISIICCFLTAPVFSESYQVGEDEIFRTTKYGKTQLGKIKIFASMLKGMIIFVLNTLLYLSIVFSTYGMSFLNNSVQVSLSPILPYPLTLGGMIALILLSGICCWFYLMSFILFVSSKTKSILSAITIPVFCVVLNFIISNWLKVKNGFIDILLKLIPNAANSLHGDLFVNYKFIEIGRTAIWSPYLSVILGILLGSMFLFLANKSYVKHQ